MNPIDFHIHPLAKKDARAAWRWYAKQSSRTADRLLHELRGALDSIAETPDRWPEYLFSTRYFQLRRFLYIVVYEYSGETIQIISVAHTKRRPGFWRRRLKP